MNPTTEASNQGASSAAPAAPPHHAGPIKRRATITWLGKDMEMVLRENGYWYEGDDGIWPCGRELPRAKAGDDE